MKRRGAARRLVPACTAIALLATGAPAAAAPTAAPTEPATAGVTVRLDPSYRGEEFQGWGTSLVWFANATGDYPDEIRNRLADMLFGSEGLNLNIARYNIGGGNAPDVPDYLRPGGAVEGWWRAPEGTTREDVDWFDPEDPADWNPDADPTQRWWVDRIKGRVDRWEAFSNSPPWFHTVSGYVSGGFDPNADQLKRESIDDFNAYLVGAVERLEDAHGIEVDTLDPFNEPGTNYWGTRLGADGQPVGGRQEGAHMGPELQQEVLRSLAEELRDADTDARISAMDETNPGIFARNWNAYPEDVRALVDQLNVHTYGTGQRTTVRDIAKGEGRTLWMSEVEGNWGDRQDFESMVPGLGMAQRIADDLRELEPAAWVFWQPVEDYDNMKPGGESALGGNWGSIQMPFDCDADDTLETCPIRTNTKFHTSRNFTHFIRPGDHLIGVDDTSSTAAVTDRGATVVHVNDTAAARAVTLDLTGFGTVTGGARVTPVVTSAAGALVRGEAVRVRDGRATVRVPAESVTTFLVEGVKGVAEDAALLQDGGVYRLRGAQSGKSVTPAGSGAVIRTDDAASTAQFWRAGLVSGGGTNRARWTLTSVSDGTRLALDADGAVVLAPAGTTGPQTEWIPSTTGDGTWTLVNAGTKRLLEVGGQATTDGAAVTSWIANSGSNQRWALVDETVRGTAPAEAFTVPGVVPVLPETVAGEYRDGTRGSLPVRWDLPGENAWRKAGTVRVRGQATDLLGRRHDATATVVVDTLTATLPARAKTAVGGTPELPPTVAAVGALGHPVEVPVAWDAAPDGAFARTGVVALTGTAQAGDGRTLPATVRVQVTEGGEALVPSGELRASATFTEPGYGVDGVLNGDLGDKAWSNWKPSDRNPSDTLTVTAAQPRSIKRVVTHFYRDGEGSWPTKLQVEVRDASGAWVKAGEPVSLPDGSAAGPVADVRFAPVLTDAVRVVMTARDSGYMTVSEIQLYEGGASTSSDAAAASISADGKPLAGFSADRSTYEAPRGTRQVTAVAADPYATVDVQQAARPGGTAVVTVTSEDGTATRRYEVRLTQR
ncbi:O-glycosyl hydrolase [Kineococcus xinjiangensis]|uniref:O-glycosyl hydrolase n=1 Tax=Kineococcus xinjiangensis TaxID=512762 RepID=A0A2S6IEJ4_9ACTN|nr:glycoside hydrolase [Kineococcus xinjiangensis]PPK92645.1 O-glycosyl hydrolase [Kineococcus xinjiangensis]